MEKVQGELIRTSDAGSFAKYTFEVRVPEIIDETGRSNGYAEPVLARLAALKDEIAQGVIRPVRDLGADVPSWNATLARFPGHSWLDAPFYWAESLFYRRILEAVGYYDAGAGEGVDPFAVKKQPELAPARMPLRVATTLAAAPITPAESFEHFLHTNLWSNRVDLSNQLAMRASHAAHTSHDDEREWLLVDDTAALWAYLEPGRDLRTLERAVIICDNAGVELGMDLALADFFLRSGLFAQVTLHVKPAPFFVSDAMPDDVEAALAALAQAGGACALLAGRLQARRQVGAFALYTHPFYTSGHFYAAMPADLRAELAQAQLALVKGDLNYRRLVYDSRWPSTTPFAEVVDYFPCPVVALRTLKSEPMLGLAPGVAEALDRDDPEWRINGKRGVIQAALLP